MEYRRLLEYPRYLKAIVHRLEKLRGGGRIKDRAKAEEMAGLWEQYDARLADHESRGIVDPALEEYRWMLEELRVSLFAQELGTSMPVSPKRLAAQWRKVRY